MAVGLVGARWALTAMHTPEDVMDHAVTYIRIYFLGMVPNLLYNMGAGILRAVGDSRRPLYFLIGSCFVNIILDVVWWQCSGWEWPVLLWQPFLPSFFQRSW